MTYSQIKELISIIEKSSFKELDLKIDNTSIRLVKDSISSKKNSSDSEDGEEILLDNISNTSHPSPIKPAQPVTVEGHVITSPLVATFYSSPTPQKPPFVKIGDTVKKGDVLCILEAMKIMNELKSDIDGKIVEILANNEEMVQFNQPLFRII